MPGPHSFLVLGHGIDTHIGSQVTELQPFDDAFALIAELVATLQADGHRIEHVDLGGGLGIPYHLDAQSRRLAGRLRLRGRPGTSRGWG